MAVILYAVIIDIQSIFTLNGSAILGYFYEKKIEKKTGKQTRATTKLKISDNKKINTSSELRYHLRLDYLLQILLRRKRQTW